MPKPEPERPVIGGPSTEAIGMLPLGKRPDNSWCDNLRSGINWKVVLRRVGAPTCAIQAAPNSRKSRTRGDHDDHTLRCTMYRRFSGRHRLAERIAHALSMQECSAKYKAAKDAGTLNGMKWNDFRKAQCGAEAAAAPPPPAAQPAPTPAPAATGKAVFPSAVSPKYSSESAGKARMHTCLDQYSANKTKRRKW